jgi:hypothetical protein
MKGLLFNERANSPPRRFAPFPDNGCPLRWIAAIRQSDRVDGAALRRRF